MKFYRCNICGNIVMKLEDTGVVMDCCGDEMEEIPVNSSDGAKEKHVPSVTVDGVVMVNVGSIDHPMIDSHYIQWILLETDHGVYIKHLTPNTPPRARFYADEDVKHVYAYCNIHGLYIDH